MKQNCGQGENLIWLLFFFVFSACLAAVLLAGAKVYQGIADRLEEQYGLHTCLSYLETRVRSYDRKGALTVDRFGGSSALVCTEGDGTGTYLTTIYCWDGQLRELYYQKGARLDPEAGERLLPMDQVTFTRQGRLLTMSCTDGGASGTVTLYLRSGDEGL